MLRKPERIKRIWKTDFQFFSTFFLFNLGFRVFFDSSSSKIFSRISRNFLINSDFKSVNFDLETILSWISSIFFFLLFSFSLPRAISSSSCSDTIFFRKSDRGLSLIYFYWLIAYFILSSWTAKNSFSFIFKRSCIVKALLFWLLRSSTCC